MSTFEIRGHVLERREVQAGFAGTRVYHRCRRCWERFPSIYRASRVECEPKVMAVTHCHDCGITYDDGRAACPRCETPTTTKGPDGEEQR